MRALRHATRGTDREARQRRSLAESSSTDPRLSDVRRASLALLAFTCLLAGGAVAGCGTNEPAPTSEFVAPGQVVQRFQQETGRRLERTVVPDAAWEQLGLGLNPSQALVRRYGIFSVYVAKQGRVAAIGSLLRDKATKKPLERGARGVYWELDSNSGTWIAYKRYARNVVLVWFSGETTQALDARWVRLDRVFAGLAS